MGLVLGPVPPSERGPSTLDLAESIVRAPPPELNSRPEQQRAVLNVLVQLTKLI